VGQVHRQAATVHRHTTHPGNLQRGWAVYPVTPTDLALQRRFTSGAFCPSACLRKPSSDILLNQVRVGAR
jgi:hypothetical protein